MPESREAKYKRIRSELPKTFGEWRFFEKEGYELLDGWTYIWDRVQEVLLEQGATLWDPSISDNVVWARTGFGLRRPGGLAYVHPGRVHGGMNPGSIKRLSAFEFGNPLQRPATTYESYDVMIRVIVVNGEGQEHLDVARRLGTGPRSFLCNNHVLPLLYEFEIEDIVFGVFPLVGASMTVAFDYWPKNSVGDVLDMILQMLEASRTWLLQALEFIHEMKIAHRDAFRDNFVVQWHPESLLQKKGSVSRPRVYIIDFEAAIQFPAEYCEEQCVTTGLPVVGSYGDPADYARPYPPECTTGGPYNAFKLDIWQLGSSLEDFKPNISSIDAVLESMTESDSAARPRAVEALISLKK
ncbi:hypothetical protein D9613_006219 [Agrocybe pediades]|uniref:Protein kinase domain-containing protein n=1 Tax=Agrocybe pediades TaxID=84607 RepID=A0A8H4VR16_9AGAR|nr:hypothetical protein D9613_006219 [Agrocybe pediades]